MLCETEVLCVVVEVAVGQDVCAIFEFVDAYIQIVHVIWVGRYPLEEVRLEICNGLAGDSHGE